MRTIKRKCLVTLLLAAVALFNSLAASAQLTVKGTVIDDTDEPLIGVSVKKKVRPRASSPTSTEITPSRYLRARPCSYFHTSA